MWYLTSNVLWSVIFSLLDDVEVFQSDVQSEHGHLGSVEDITGNSLSPDLASGQRIWAVLGGI